jgi:hypothetical protein
MGSVDFVTTKVAKDLARQSRNRRFGISPAKTQRPQRKLLSELGALRALAGEISESEMFCVVIRFARGAQILKHHEDRITEMASNLEEMFFFPSCASWWHRFFWLRLCCALCGKYCSTLNPEEPEIITGLDRMGYHREVIFMPHDHKYIIADDQAVQVLLDKMLGGGTRQKRREKLLKAQMRLLGTMKRPTKRRGKLFSTDC